MNENIGMKIKKYRQQNNMTQKELANLIHVEHSTISNWERGKRKIDIETANKLSKILGFSLDDSSQVENNNAIYKSIEYRNFKSEIQKKYIIVKLLVILIFVGFSVALFGGDINFISIFAVVYMIFILYDVLLLFKPKVDIDHFNVSQNKKVFLENNIKEDQSKRDLTKRVCIIIGYYIILILALSLSLTFLYQVDQSLAYVFVLSIIVISIVFIYFIFRELHYWEKKKKFEYKKFQYKKDLFLNRLIIVIFDLLVLFTLTTTSYYGNEFTNTGVMVFLYMTSLFYYGIGYNLYINKLIYLSDFSLNH
jgi:transcriptional regulator with XRE-family HTH domain